MVDKFFDLALDCFLAIKASVRNWSAKKSKYYHTNKTINYVAASCTGTKLNLTLHVSFQNLKAHKIQQKKKQFYFCFWLKRYHIRKRKQNCNQVTTFRILRMTGPHNFNNEKGRSDTT